MPILIDSGSRILVQGITGREAVSTVRAGLDYGARIVAGVTPGKGGGDVHGVPVFDTVGAAVRAVGPVDVALCSVPPGFARDAALEAIEAGIPLLVVTTERMPRLDVAQLVALAARHGARVIGPNTMGLISPGRTKVGPVGGPAANTDRAYRPGPVGLMSRSGGMTTEIASLLSLSGIGQSTAISIGGDPVIGSTFADLYPLFEADPATEVVAIYGEPGGSMEQELARYLRDARPATPCVAFIAGAFMAAMPGVRFGHAGTIVSGEEDTAQAKGEALRAAGALVARELSEIPGLVRQALERRRATA